MTTPAETGRNYFLMRIEGSTLESTDEECILVDTSLLIEIGRILLGLLLNSVILLVLVYRMADIPEEVRKPGTLLLVVLTTLVWWLAEDKHGRLFGDLCVVAAIPVLFLFTKSCCRVDWDVAWKVSAVFFVVFSIVVIGLGRGADAIAPERTRLTVQFHRMLDEQAGGVPYQRPSLAASIAEFHRKMDAIRQKLTDMVTRKESRAKLQGGLNVILQAQRERQQMFEDAGYGDLLGGGVPQEEINLTGSMKQVSTQFDKGISLLKGIKAAQDASSGSDDAREEAMLKYREKITAEGMTGAKSSLPDSDIPVDSKKSLKDLFKGLSGTADPGEESQSGGANRAEAAAVPESPQATARASAAGAAAATASAAAPAAPDAEPAHEIGAEESVPRETMIDSEWSAKHDQIAWANTGDDPAKDAVTVRLTTYDEQEGLQGLKQGGTADEWRTAHKKLRVSGIMKSDTGGYVVLIGTEIYYPGDLVNVTLNGTSYWWRLTDVSKRDVSWDPAGLRPPGESE